MGSLPPQRDDNHQEPVGHGETQVKGIIITTLNLNQAGGVEEQGELGAALSEADLSVSSPPRRYGHCHQHQHQHNQHHHHYQHQGLNCNPHNDRS